MKWIGQHIYDLAARFRGDVTIEGDLTVNGTYTQIDTDVTTTEQWLVTNDGTGPAAIINQKGSQDIFDVQDDGTSVFYIEDGGNVGIGTTAPTEKLEVVGDIKLSTSNASYYLKIENNLSYANPFNLISAFGLEVLSVNSGQISTATNAGANFGIGTSSPSDKLDVQGGYLRVGYSGGAQMKILPHSSNNGYGFYDVNNANADMWFKDGNVGIGTGLGSTPSANLQLGSFGAANQEFRIESAGNSYFSILTTNGVQKIYAGGAGTQSNEMAFYTSSSGTESEHMRIDNSGNVGIGTTSPSAKLQVVSNTNPQFMLSGDSGAGISFIDTDTSQEDYQIIVGANDMAFRRVSDASDRIRLYGTTGNIVLAPSSGNVGIGTSSPANKLDVVSTGTYAARFRGPSATYVQSGESTLSGESGFLARNSTGAFYLGVAGGVAYLLGTSGANTMTLGVGGAEKMRITSAGNVGIGTSSPSAKLEVVGQGAGTVKIGSSGFGGDWVGISLSGALNTSNYNLLGSSANSSFYLNRPSGGDMFFRCNNADQMIIKASGNVGIGTTSPGQKLEVNGNAVVSGNMMLGSSASGEYITRTGSPYRLGLFTNSAERISVINGGNVGIGTTSPASKLHVAGTVQVGVDDTGHDVKFFGATSGRYMLWDESYDGLILSDNTKLQLGSSTGHGDLQLLHDGTNSYVKNHFGDLYIMNNADDKDIIFQSDDGAGGLATYFSLDGGQATHSGSATTALYTIWPDKSTVALGSNKDLQLAHNGSESSIVNNTGNLVFYQKADDGDIIFQSDDGSGGLATYLTIDGGSVQTKFFKQTEHQDGVLGGYGNGMDLQLQHSGTDSYIDNYTGDLYVRSFADDKDIIFQSDNGAGGVATYFSLDGSSANHDGSSTTALYTNWPDNSRISLGSSHDFSMKHTGSDTHQENLTGDLYFTNYADDKDIIFRSDDGSGGVTAYLTLDGSRVRTVANQHLQMADGKALYVGDSSDAGFYHSGGNNYIENSVGNLYISNYADDKDIIFQSDDGSGGVETYFSLDGSVGMTVFPDAKKLAFGSSFDLKIEHDGSNSYLSHEGTGNLIIRNTTDDADISFQSDDGSGGLTEYFRLDGGGELTYFRKHIQLADSQRAYFGSIGDLSIHHDGSNSYVNNITGDFYIRNKAADKSIIFQADDGSSDGSSIETYFQLEGASGGGQPFTVFPDASVLSFGTSHDLRIEHTGSHSVIDNYVGDVIFTNNTDDGDIIFKSDNGSGGVTTYFQLDGSAGLTTVSKNIKFFDSVSAVFGTGADSYVRHTGSNMEILNTAGNIVIDSATDDADIIFKGTDGGADITALTLDMSAAGQANFNSHVYLPDAARIKLGAGHDLQMWHESNHSYIANATGNLTITNNTDDGDIIFQSDDGSGGVTEYLRIDGGEGRLVHSANSRYLDGVVAMFGTGADLQINHDGSNSYISNHSGGHLYIQQNFDDRDIVLQCDDGSGGTTAYLTLDGSAGYITVQKAMRFGDGKTLQLGDSADLSVSHDATDSFITEKTGDLYVQNTANDKDIIFQSDDGSGGVTAYLTLDGSATQTLVHKHINFDDAISARFGGGGDMHLLHDGSNSHVVNYVGDLKITQNANDKDIIFNCDDGSGGNTAYLTLDGSQGFTTVQKKIQFSDSVEATFGAGNDLKIAHISGNNYITGETGNLYIRNGSAADKDIIFQADNGSGGNATYFYLDGSTEEVVFSKPIVTAETKIKVLPHHFMSNEDGGANKSAQFRDETIIGVRTSSDDAELYAFVEIPYGKTARTVTVYGNDTSLVVNVYESDINAGALTDKTPGGGCVVGTSCDITDVAYSATNYLVIKVTTLNYTNDVIYGAEVVIG